MKIILRRALGLILSVTLLLGNGNILQAAEVSNTEKPATYDNAEDADATSAPVAVEDEEADAEATFNSLPERLPVIEDKEDTSDTPAVPSFERPYASTLSAQGSINLRSAPSQNTPYLVIEPILQPVAVGGNTTLSVVVHGRVHDDGKVNHGCEYRISKRHRVPGSLNGA